MKYRRIPKEVEAIQWTGANPEEVIGFMGDEALVVAINATGKNQIWIQTNRGNRIVCKGDWIIKHDQKNLTVIRESHFHHHYEPVDKL